MEKFENILIVRTDRIGDVMLTLPAVKALRHAYPKAKITMMVAFAARELVKHHPLLDDVIVDDRKVEHKGVLGFRRLIKAVKQKNFDCAFVLHTKRRSNLICFLAGIPKRIGYKNDKYGFLLTQGLKDERHLGLKHEARYCLDVLKSIGVQSEVELTSPAFQQYAEEWADQWLEDNQIQSDDVLIAIHPHASDDSKCWPGKQFAELINALQMKYQAKVVLIGARTGYPRVFNVLSSVKDDVLDLTGAITIAQLTSLLRRCCLLVSNDSGPVHIGAGVKIPVISLFLRNQPGINPERWKPLGPKGHVLCNKSGEEVVLDTKGQVVSGRMDSISSAEVCHLVDEILSHT